LSKSRLLAIGREHSSLSKEEHPQMPPAASVSAFRHTIVKMGAVTARY